MCPRLCSPRAIRFSTPESRTKDLVPIKLRCMMPISSGANSSWETCHFNQEFVVCQLRRSIPFRPKRQFVRLLFFQKLKTPSVGPVCCICVFKVIDVDNVAADSPWLYSFPDCVYCLVSFLTAVAPKRRNVSLSGPSNKTCRLRLYSLFNLVAASHCRCSSVSPPYETRFRSIVDACRRVRSIE